MARTYDHVRERGQFHYLLDTSIRQMLNDARDALTFEPPHVEAAQQRIEMALAAIDAKLERMMED